MAGSTLPSGKLLQLFCLAGSPLSGVNRWQPMPVYCECWRPITMCSDGTLNGALSELGNAQQSLKFKVQGLTIKGWPLMNESIMY